MDKEVTGLVASRPALVPLTSGTGKMGFKFEDCVAVYCNEVYDANHPNGYGHVRLDKYGHTHKCYSQVEGYIGGAIGVVIYPQQFGLVSEPGIPFKFRAKPGDILEACVQLVREELHPPEYII